MTLSWFGPFHLTAILALAATAIRPSAAGELWAVALPAGLALEALSVLLAKRFAARNDRAAADILELRRLNDEAEARLDRLKTR